MKYIKEEVPTKQTDWIRLQFFDVRASQQVIDVLGPQEPYQLAEFSYCVPTKDRWMVLAITNCSNQQWTFLKAQFVREIDQFEKETRYEDSIEDGNFEKRKTILIRRMVSFVEPEMKVKPDDFFVSLMGLDE